MEDWWLVIGKYTENKINPPSKKETVGAYSGFPSSFSIWKQKPRIGTEMVLEFFY